ncbi:Zinc finger MYM-type protein 1 [Merluccius polli]|uniref:Zinc finger MYM-type protein 1 n=1 Tax=Merluccius polli TaxID=89951 RepID=A0AA47N642_MERPO|nr:Zinc finger MYM-type protein 1 [Merluccius polli]
MQYSIIIDGTQDVSGEQESICIRYVDQDLVPHEVFVGLYEVSGTTGEAIARMARDVLLRLNIPIACLRGQTYDGAANMSGKHSGVQAEMKRQQPLALYVHCGTHCLNLITQSACESSPLIHGALQWVHELGTLCKLSGKFKGIFLGIKAASGDGASASLRPLCPTRWTVRGKAIKAVLSQYENVLTSLEEMGANTGTTGAKANGLKEHFEKGKTVLGLILAIEVIEVLECLNKSLQKRTETITGMKSAIDCVRSTVQGKRSETSFQVLYDKAVEMVESLGIEPIQVPHQRPPPKRYTGGASQYIPKTTVEHYRVEYYRMLDCVDAQFEARFNQPDLKILQELDDMLVTGEVSEIVGQYPELDMNSLKIQLSMFRSSYQIKSTTDAADIMRKMPVEVRGLFNQVETLLRLLLVIPASSSEAEQSFSALRRLKTWLRSSMTQMRLNHAAVCHVHQDMLDDVDTQQICQQFIDVNEKRRHVFGSFI